MTRIEKVYPDSDSLQMRTCDDCSMPDVFNENRPEIFGYSLLKHVIIETRAVSDDPEELEAFRAVHEAKGTAELVDAALKCLNCAEGICLLIEGRESSWRIGGKPS